MKLISDVLGIKIYTVDYIKSDEVLLLTDNETIKIKNIGFKNANKNSSIEERLLALGLNNADITPMVE